MGKEEDRDDDDDKFLHRYVTGRRPAHDGRGSI